MRARATLGEPLVNWLDAHFTTLAKNENIASDNLSHTRMLMRLESPVFAKGADLIARKLVEF